MAVFRSQIFAVDPGLNGAWACLDFNGEFIAADEIPRFSKLINAVEMADIIRLHNPKQMIIEQVGPMPKQGVVSVFTFGAAYGMILGLAFGLGIPIHLVSPGLWKRHFKLLGKPKDVSRERAIQLFPATFRLLKRKKDHGKADALLLARYFLDRKAAGSFT